MNKQILKAISNLEKRVVDLYNKLKVIPKPTYKVYTALLTQSGVDDSQSLAGSGSLVVGVTYLIDDDGGSGWDFTNVGAPNNDIGTYFVATGTTPNSWGFSGYLTYNTGAPVVTVLENTIGDIWFTYYAVGFYNIKSNSLFTDKKTTFLFGVIDNNPGNAAAVSTDYFGNNIDNYSFMTINISGNAENEFLYNTLIEIRVYN